MVSNFPDKKVFTFRRRVPNTGIATKSYCQKTISKNGTKNYVLKISI